MQCAAENVMAAAPSERTWRSYIRILSEFQFKCTDHETGYFQDAIDDLLCVRGFDYEGVLVSPIGMSHPVSENRRTQENDAEPHTWSVWFEAQIDKIGSDEADKISIHGFPAFLQEQLRAMAEHPHFYVMARSAAASIQVTNVIVSRPIWRFTTYE